MNIIILLVIMESLQEIHNSDDSMAYRYMTNLSSVNYHQYQFAVNLPRHKMDRILLLYHKFHGLQT